MEKGKIWEERIVESEGEKSGKELLINILGYWSLICFRFLYVILVYIVF